MKILILCFIIISFQYVAESQILSTSKSTTTFNNTLIDAYEVVITCEKDKAKSFWNDFMEDENNTEIKGFGLFKKKDLLETEMTIIKSISNEPVKLFVQFSEEKASTSLIIFAKKQNNLFVSSTASEDLLTFENLKRLSHRYLNYFLPKYHQNKIELAEEKLEDSQKDLEKIIKNINKNEEDIKDNNEEIIKLKDEIEELKKDTEKTKKELKKNKKEEIKLTTDKNNALKTTETEKNTLTELQIQLKSLEPK